LTYLHQLRKRCYDILEKKDADALIQGLKPVLSLFSEAKPRILSYEKQKLALLLDLIMFA